MSSSNSATSPGHESPTLRGMADDMKDAAQEKLGAAADKVQQIGSTVRHAVHDQLEGLQHRAADYYQQGRAKVNDLNHTLENRVRAQPMTYLLVAGSLGFALGFLLTRR